MRARDTTRAALAWGLRILVVFASWLACARGNAQLLPGTLTSEGQQSATATRTFVTFAMSNAVWTGMPRLQALPRKQALYRVRVGDTLSQIAATQHASVHELMRLNSIVDPDALQVGQRIALPQATAGDEDPETIAAEETNKPESVGTGPVTFVSPNGPVKVQLVDSGGLVRLDGLHTLQALMEMENDGDQVRCHVHPRLALLLARISAHFDGRAIRIVSGYRRARGFTRPTSRHTMCRATDIQVNGVSRRRVWNYCRSLQQTGCGYYPRSVFLHVDVRAENAQWVDWSQPGRRPRYGTLQRPYTQQETRSATRPRVPRRVTRPDELPLTVRVADANGAVVRLVDEQPGAASLAALADELLQQPLPPLLASAKPSAGPDSVAETRDTGTH